MELPSLLPHLRPLWRDRRTLQLGTDPDRAVIVEFAEPVSARVLGLIDGTRSERALLRDAATLGVGTDEVQAVLGALQRAGVLVDAPALVPRGMPVPRRRRLLGEATALATRCLLDPGPAAASPAQLLRRRAASRVLIAGQVRIATPIAVALAAAGVGHVAVPATGTVTVDDLAPGGLCAADVGRPAALATVDAIGRAAPDATTALLGPDEATFLVRVGFEPTPATLAARGYARRRLPHLAVAARDGAMVVGPFVPPAGSPCLACLDLHRADRDPAWRTLAAQLATEPPPAPACAVSTLLIGVGYAAAEVLAYLDGAPPRTRGVTIEIDGAGAERRRRWTAHPQCDCRLGRRSQRGPGKN
jgi:bacteriocin biosynthesis cyclodehydratase domain-containing protein